MKITSISYQSVKNLGNYESERLEATATVEEGEDPALLIKNLRKFVHAQLIENPESLFDGDEESARLFDGDEDDDDPLFDTSLKSNLVHNTLNESNESDSDF